jgi:hypothetical protein
MSEAAEASEAQTEEFAYIEREPAAPAAAAPPADGGEVALAEPLLDPDEKWIEEGVREHLVMVGSGVHELWGKADSDWEMSERDLERIAPPLTRLLNRYEPARRLSAASDPLLLGYGTTLYAYRSLLQRRAALAEEREAAEALVEHDVGGYEEVPGTPAPSSSNGRAAGSVLRFPEAAKGARSDEGQ